MTKEEFKQFCKEEFYKRGFKKIKNRYFLVGDKGVLCSLDFQKSDYGPQYYINCSFYISFPLNSSGFPSFYDYDIDAGRILVLSKYMDKGKFFMTGQIPYEEYTPEELKPFFDMYLEEQVIPAVMIGKQVLLQNIGQGYKWHPHLLRPNEVMDKISQMSD